MIYYILSLVISSFLLFQIQPLIGKYILPWFGSSPAVWSASLLFFQSLLTLGYAYSYWLTGKFAVKQQAKIHIGLIGISVIGLGIMALFWSAPILPNASFQPDQWTNPFWLVMRVLFFSVGIPFFLLSTNSTLLQSWFSRIYPNKSPYRLYALSNFASLVGLLSYPFLVELYFTVDEQAWLWSIFYGVFAFSVCLIGWKILNIKQTIVYGDEYLSQSPEIKDQQFVRKPKIVDIGLWFLLPAIASVLLLATTNQITQEIAVIPLLWVFPLALYLISFILTFESDRWYGRKRFTFVLGFAVFAYWLLVSKGPLVGIEIQIATYSLLMFVCCMICHGELSLLRPEAKHLTSYYLMISIGGAAGGIFVNLIAPIIFTQYLELFIGLSICCLMLIAVTVFIRREIQIWKTAFLVVVQVVILAGIVFIAVRDFKATLRGTLWMDRNFFGVLRVKEKVFEPVGDLAYQLVHGITIHGLQFVEGDNRNLSTTYYTETSGVGLAYKFSPNEQSKKVGVLGLGVGTIAAYGGKNDLIRFYEINPSVIGLANGSGNYFNYLSNSQADVEIVPGDARLSLTREYNQTGSQEYDLLVLDTFSSDSIPIHLITFEAFDLYFKHLKWDGVLAVHISNIHLDLEPVVNEITKTHQVSSVLIAGGKTRLGSSASVWILATRDQGFLVNPEILKFSKKHEEVKPKVQLWTDDYSNLFQIIR